MDADVIYYHATGGVRLVKDLYAVAGVRRFALKYDIRVSDFAEFERKPGLWDPVVGVAWHTEGDRWLEVHAAFEAGGFGVGAESELSAMFRVDFKPVQAFRHLRGLRTALLQDRGHGPEPDVPRRADDARASGRHRLLLLTFLLGQLPLDCRARLREGRAQEGQVFLRPADAALEAVEQRQPRLGQHLHANEVAGGARPLDIAAQARG